MLTEGKLKELKKEGKIENIETLNSLIGFKLKRENSFTYYWFGFFQGRLFFDHSYNQNTGRVKRSFRSLPSILKY